MRRTVLRPSIFGRGTRIGATAVFSVQKQCNCQGRLDTHSQSKVEASVGSRAPEPSTKPQAIKAAWPRDQTATNWTTRYRGAGIAGRKASAAASRPLTHHWWNEADWCGVQVLNRLAAAKGGPGQSFSQLVSVRLAGSSRRRPPSLVPQMRQSTRIITE